MSKPVILVAIADYGRENNLHLRGLIPELEAILQVLTDHPACKVIPVLDASIEKIIDAFLQIDEPIVGFHFAGHGNGYELALKESIQGKKFARFLGKQAALEWIFLNSCASDQHAKHLINEGINAVITTSRAIRDDVAFAFAKGFYSRLANYDTLQEAYQYYPLAAEMKEQGGKGTYRDRIPVTDLVYDPLWNLHIRPGAEEVQEWTLLKASGNPLLGLPPIPTTYPLPSKPFRSLEWFQREHAEIFFGRGQEIFSLYKFATADSSHAPLALLYGKSGVGKSSLLEAGVLPRLETSHSIYYRRRDAEIGLSQMLLNALNIQKAEGITQAWRAIEDKEGKALLLIFDQLEEVFTRPRSEGVKELTQFLGQLAVLFNRPNNHLQGKVILSFRKEFLSEIHDAVKQHGLAHLFFPIKPLEKAGICEAITGICSSQRLQQQYHLKVEEGLAEQIADQLLEDQHSSIAPVLQILLSKLWEEAVNLNPQQPSFTLDAYQQIRRKG
ncbi:MAG: hypothetical protein AAFQ87_23145, partial [Bacteroidota bacterium]